MPNSFLWFTERVTSKPERSADPANFPVGQSVKAKLSVCHRPQLVNAAWKFGCFVAGNQVLKWVHGISLSGNRGNGESGIGNRESLFRISIKPPTFRRSGAVAGPWVFAVFLRFGERQPAFDRAGPSVGVEVVSHDLVALPRTLGAGGCHDSGVLSSGNQTN